MGTDNSFLKRRSLPTCPETALYTLIPYQAHETHPSIHRDASQLTRALLETLARVAQTLRLADAVEVDLVGDPTHEPAARLALVPGLGGGAQQVAHDDATVPLAPGGAALVVARGVVVVYPTHGHAVARGRRRALVRQVAEEAGARVGPGQGFGGAGYEVVAAGGDGSS
ncbi:hypothetical protein PG991_005029 [Apiospora marii]|uniref:Uncharacterized protein n=1 Tax=Apiospora marii TaxID=335849 RepID=A0ABR1S9E6_9PEZI